MAARIAYSDWSTQNLRLQSTAKHHVWLTFALRSSFISRQVKSSYCMIITKMQESKLTTLISTLYHGDWSTSTILNMAAKWQTTLSCHEVMPKNNFEVRQIVTETCPVHIIFSLLLKLQNQNSSERALSPKINSGDIS